MGKIISVFLFLLALGVLPLIATAQSSPPFDFPQARLNGLISSEGTRYVFILPYNNTDALYDLSVMVDLPLGTQLISAQQANTMQFVGASATESAFRLYWRATEILSGELFPPFAFTIMQPLTDFIPATITWRDSLDQTQTTEIILAPNTFNAVEGGASFNPEAPIPAEQFTFIGNSGVVIYTSQELPASAITVREAPATEDPPAELGDFWWCSGLELQGASGVTVYVPLRKPLPPLMPLTLFAQIGGQWQILDVQGYVSADGLYAVYDHPGGLVFTGTEGENNPVEAPPAPPPPPDSDGDGFTDDVDSCPNAGDAGFGIDGSGCPLPPPDSDNDGFPDPNDVCPTQGDAGFGLDASGCPLPPPPPPPDSDGDGRPDNADSCPNEGDLGFGIDGDGCAVPQPADSDADGIPDFGDICPNEGDLGLGLNSDGCPILPPLDSDTDGIPDFSDVCPNQGDGGFGLTADGCPLLPSLTPTSEIPAPTDIPAPTLTATTAPLPTPPPPALVKFDFAQFTVIFGTTAQAQVEIAAPALADVRVQIQPLAGANNVPFRFAPSEVIIFAGQTSASFGVFAEANVSGFITLQATLPDNPNSRLISNILVQPLTLTGITVSSTTLLPGQLVTGSIQMSSPSEFDTSIQLVSNSPDIFPNPVVMPAGQINAPFEFVVAQQMTTSQAQLTASFGDTAIFGGQSVTSGVLELKSQVNYVVTFPEIISTPGDYVGEIVLLDPVLPISTTFLLSSPRADVVVPNDAILPAGTDRVQFSFTVADGAVFNEEVAINALELATGTLTSGSFRLHTLRIQSVAFAESTLTAGIPSVARVTLNAPVPSGVAELIISMNNPDVIPNLTPIDIEAGLYAVQISQGESTAQFDVTVAPSAIEDSSVIFGAIFPADVSATASADVLGGVRILSLDFGTQPIIPGRSAVGVVRLNIPAPATTQFRIVPLDSSAFAFTFPQAGFIFAGATSVSVNFIAAGNFTNPRVGFLVHLASQTPTEGVTGFFDISPIQVTSVELTSPMIALDTPSSIIVRLNQPFPTNGSVFIQAIGGDGFSTNLVNATSNIIPAGATEVTIPLVLSSNAFSNSAIIDTISVTLRVSLGVNIPAAGMIPVDTVIQVRPSLIIDTVSSSGGGTPNTAPIFASDATMTNLLVRFRGATSTTGGTIRVSSSHPEFVILTQDTFEVPPNTALVSVPLKLINSDFGQNQQSITFTVTDANGANPKTVVISFVRPRLNSFTIREARSFNGVLVTEGSVSSNTNFSLTCGNPCYLQVGSNGTFISNRTTAPGNFITTNVPFGLPFQFAAFDVNETLSTTVTARVGADERTATYETSRAIGLTGGISVLQDPQGRNYLVGSVGMNSSSQTTVSVHLQSSLPNVIPPAFYTQENSGCTVSGSGRNSIPISSFFGTTGAWCMDVREEAVSQPTSVTITILATTTERGMTHTSRKSFTIVVSPSGAVGTPTPTRTPIILAGVATPFPAVQNLAQNVVINIATATPAPTNTLAPIATPRPIAPVVQLSQFSPISIAPAPVTVSLSVNATTRRGTVSISATRTTDLVINLSSSNRNVVGVPSSVTIPRGSRSVSFDFTTNTRSIIISPTTIRITASGGGSSTSANITLRR